MWKSASVVLVNSPSVEVEEIPVKYLFDEMLLKTENQTIMICKTNKLEQIFLP
jgi:hypothetical protein